MTKAMLAASVPAMALAMVAAMPAAAQTAPAADSGDIVVPAQKREQRLLDVPVSISAVSSEALTTAVAERVAAFLASDDAAFITGQNLAVNGGMAFI